MEDEVEVLTISCDSVVLRNKTRQYTVNLSDVTSVLYRQGNIVVGAKKSTIEDKLLQKFVVQENSVLQEFIFNKLFSKDHLGHPQLADLNKLIVLEKAIEIGLLVPEYIYTGSLIDLSDFKARFNKIITKPIQPAFYFEDENYFSAAYTELLTDVEFGSLPSEFHPTFFQKLVPKKYDIRVFFLRGDFYSIAIVSQKNEKTKIDYRNYDRGCPNRQVPFKLPSNIETKLAQLSLDLRLEYCSIDLIYGTDNQFYFLEINPVGQFGVVSYAGNYYLEKRISEML